MGVFNYSRYHYFDKDGHELILSHKPGVRINIINDNIPEFYAEYALVKSTPDVVDPATNSSLHQIKAGMRFDVEDGTTFRVKTSILDSSTDDTYIGDAFLRKGTYELKYYTSTFGRENYREINFVLGKTLNYYTKNELERLFGKYSVIVEEEVRVLSFKTPKDVLKHIQNTGVNAISDESTS